MAKQSITIRFPYDNGWDAGDRVQVFCDFGSGTIDVSKPLLSRAVELFPGKTRARGFGQQPLGVGRFGDGKAARPPGALGRTIFGVTPFGTAPPLFGVVVDAPPVHGAWKFAARAVDRFGNVQAASLAEKSVYLSATDPTPIGRFALASYDAGTDVVTFDLVMGTE